MLVILSTANYLAEQKIVDNNNELALSVSSSEEVPVTVLYDNFKLLDLVDIEEETQ